MSVDVDVDVNVWMWVCDKRWKDKKGEARVNKNLLLLKDAFGFLYGTGR